MNLEDFTALLDYLGVRYALSGPNTKRGNVNVPCPWCGDDPSEHLGVDPVRGVYGCWRNRQHRGRRLARLVSALANVPLSTAQTMLGQQTVPEFEDAIDRIASGAFLDKKEEESQLGGVKELKLNPEFRPLNEITLPSRRFHLYLQQRGFGTLWDTLKLAGRYNLYYSFRYRFSGRIILPVYFEKKLVTWTSRSVYSDARIRYDTLNVEFSVMNIKHTVYNFDRARAAGGRILYIVEGPLDCLKLDYGACNAGCRAVALFNTSALPQQLYSLSVLSERFDHAVVLLDRGGVMEEQSAQVLREELSSVGFKDRVTIGTLPKGVKDPGDLSLVQTVQLCNKHLKWLGL